MLPVLKERQSRIYLGVEADSLGWGGISKVHQLLVLCTKYEYQVLIVVR
jgi:hypothetical protein